MRSEIRDAFYIDTLYHTGLMFTHSLSLTHSALTHSHSLTHSMFDYCSSPPPLAGVLRCRATVRATSASAAFWRASKPPPASLCAFA